MKADTILQTAEGNKTYLRIRTLDDMQQALTWAKDNAADYGSVTGRAEFTGTSSIDAYRDMLRDGWAAGVAGVEGLDGLSSDHAERLSFARSPCGAFPIVPAFLAGAPDAMLRPVTQPVDNVRSLTLVIDAAYSCHVNSATALEYAHAVMRLIAWLQAEQIDAAVYSSICMRSANLRMLYLIPVRELGDVFAPERIASALHPSFLRRGWFALVERDHIEKRLPGTHCCNSGYGCAQTATTQELAKALPDAASIILLPKVGSSDPDKAIREAVNLKLRQKDY